MDERIEAKLVEKFGFVPDIRDWSIASACYEEFRRQSGLPPARLRGQDAAIWMAVGQRAKRATEFGRKYVPHIPKMFTEWKGEVLPPNPDLEDL